MRAIALELKHELIGLAGVVERNVYLTRRYIYWDIAFFVWTVANTLTIVFIAEGIEASGGDIDVDRATTTLLIGAVVWAYLGWAFRALRDDEVAAELAGVDVARYRVYAATIGSAMIGLTGAVVAYSSGFISPSTYDFERVDVRVLVLVAFGGLGTLLGPVIGAGVFAILDERLTESLQLREVLYGIFVIAIFLFFRRGVVHAVVSLYNRLTGPRRKTQTLQPSRD